MMAFYKASEKFGMECMQLTPAFDIDLFAEPDNEEYNMVGDEMENPFFGTAPAGTQQMPLVSAYNWPTYSKAPIKRTNVSYVHANPKKMAQKNRCYF